MQRVPDPCLVEEHNTIKDVSELLVFAFVHDSANEAVRMCSTPKEDKCHAMGVGRVGVRVRYAGTHITLNAEIRAQS